MNLLFERANARHATGVAKLQTDVFLTREPMTMALGFSELEYRSYLEKLYAAIIEQTQSFVAIDADTGEIVSISIAADKVMGPLDIFLTEKEISSLAISDKFFALFDDVLAPYNIDAPKTASIMTYGATDEHYLRMGIVNKLAKLCEDEIARQGYRYILVFATNEKSSNKFDKDDRYIKLKSLNYSQSGIPAFKDVDCTCVLYISEIR